MLFFSNIYLDEVSAVDVDPVECVELTQSRQDRPQRLVFFFSNSLGKSVDQGQVTVRLQTTWIKELAKIAVCVKQKSSTKRFVEIGHETMNFAFDVQQAFSSSNGNVSNGMVLPRMWANLARACVSYLGGVDKLHLVAVPGGKRRQPRQPWTLQDLSCTSNRSEIKRQKGLCT